MGQDKKNEKQRKIDKNIKHSFQEMAAGFSLVSNVDIQAWKAYLAIFFVAGFFASLIWGAYNSWYINTKASATAEIYTLTDNEAHKAGENFQTQIFLNTSSQNIVAVQAVATFDPATVSVIGIDDSVTDFPSEVLKNIDSQNNKIIVAETKATPGVNSSQAKLATVSLTALKDFNGAGVSLKFLATSVVDYSAAILDNGQGTNVLTAVSSKFTNPAPTSTSDTTPTPTPTPTPTSDTAPAPTPTPAPDTAAPAPTSDTAPPVISNGLPTGVLSYGTKTATISVVTNEKATCKFATDPRVSFAKMTRTLSTSDGLSQSKVLTGFRNGKTYKYYVRCKDSAGNANSSSYRILFSIARSAQ